MTTETDEHVPTPESWGLVEIMGHRSHYGRLTEEKLYGVTMLRIDTPEQTTFGDAGDVAFKTHYYSPGSIFSITPMTEAAVMERVRTRRPAFLLEVHRDDDDGDGYDDDGIPI